jgi:hypothetical protein
MIPVLQGQNFDNAAAFVGALNQARLANKQKWIVYQGTVAGRKVAIKSFDASYPQILRVDGIEYGGAMDLKVNAWKKQIENAIGPATVTA